MRLIQALKEDLSILRGNLLVLIVTWVLMHFGYSMAFPFESPYIKALGASEYIIGLMYSISYLILFIVRIPGSYIADKYGRKRIIALMTFGVGFAYLFYAFAFDWRIVLIGMVIGNLCLIYQPALEAITADSIPPEKRGLGFAMTRVIPEIPGMVGPAIAGYLVSLYGLIPSMRLIYLIISIMVLTAAIIRLLFLRETLSNIRDYEEVSLIGIYRNSIKALLDAWKKVSRNLKILTIVLMISSFEDPIFMTFASLYVLDVIRISKLEWGYVAALWSISVILFGIPMGKLVDKLGRKRSLALSYLLFIPFTVWFINARSAYELAVIMTIFGLGSMIIGPSFNALVADMVPRELRGRIMGLIGNLNIVSMAISYMIGGILYYIKPSLPFYIVALIGFINLIIISLFIEEPYKKEI